MKFFSVDSPLYKFISTFWVVVKLNFFWLLFSLPIVTIGASTTAAFAVGLKMADGSEGYIFQAFWAAFKENWKKGIPLGLLNLLIAYAVYLDFELFEKLEGNPFICLVMGILAIAIGISGFMYSYALLARYENSFINTMKNSFEIYTRYFGRSIVMTAIVALEVVVMFWNTTTMYFMILIRPGLHYLHDKCRCVIYF